ncbi:hypothetical protein ATANTOWER_015986 [Ataeniobius toweri]|uniref:Secreted protein n=1 Tax=Ataeniobius toweri TaxID=208326 RepID=A0ABU7B977_9TELE|nr:hypothetical protein [Ataeniobius toweri]
MHLCIPPKPALIALFLSCLAYVVLCDNTLGFLSSCSPYHAQVSIGNHTPAIHSCLQPSLSRTTSWEHLTFTHLPVHPSTPHAQAQQSNSRIAPQEELCSVPHNLPVTVTVEKNCLPPTSLHHPST